MLNVFRLQLIMHMTHDQLIKVLLILPAPVHIQVVAGIIAIESHQSLQCMYVPI